MLTPFDFNFVFQKSTRVSSPYITLIARKNLLNHPRLGFAIAKKQIKRAHERNRIKRIAREYFRHHQHDLPHIDFIIIAKYAAINIDNHQLAATLDSLCQKILRKIEQ